MALVLRSRLLRKVGEIAHDPLYRGSLVLLANTTILAVLGFAFWTLAARSYPAATVGSFFGLTSGIGLVSAIAALGLPNMITRHLTSGWVGRAARCPRLTGPFRHGPPPNRACQ